MGKPSGIMKGQTKRIPAALPIALFLSAFFLTQSGAQQCGSDPQAPICSADEDCCKDSPDCKGACTECCVRQSTFCVAPRQGFTTSTCCPRWTVSCTVGSVGCCDPATPWQKLGTARRTSVVAPMPSVVPLPSSSKASVAYALFPQ